MLLFLFHSVSESSAVIYLDLDLGDDTSFDIISPQLREGTSTYPTP